VAKNNGPRSGDRSWMWALALVVVGLPVGWLVGRLPSGQPTTPASSPAFSTAVAPAVARVAPGSPGASPEAPAPSEVVSPWSTLDAAMAEPHLAATVINYGHLATEPADLGKIQAPILGLFGGQDRGITPDDVKKFQLAMEKQGKKIEVKIYPDAGHAFENPNNKARYRADDAADAWQRTVAFLAATLKK